MPGSMITLKPCRVDEPGLVRISKRSVEQAADEVDPRLYPLAISMYIHTSTASETAHATETANYWMRGTGKRLTLT